MIALAEGLQTTFWRINSPTVRWISLALPAVISLREKLLPTSPQITHLTASALDPSWHQHVDPQTPTLITAEGLLMYLHRDQALTLINNCAQRNPHGAMVFDIIPPLAKSPKGRQLTPHYRTPPMTFALTSGQARALPQKYAYPGFGDNHPIRTRTRIPRKNAVSPPKLSRPLSPHRLYHPPPIPTHSMTARMARARPDCGTPHSGRARGN